MRLTLQQLNDFLLSKSKKRAERNKPALLAACLFLQAESQKLCPVKTGALRNSAGSRVDGFGFDAVGKVFYRQKYALWVHENLDAHHTVGQAKFLEQPAREKRKQIIDVYKRVLEGKQT